MADAAEGDGASPAPSRASAAADLDNDNHALPMPNRRPAASQTTAEPSALSAPPPPPTPALKRDGRPRPWTVEIPRDAPKYPTAAEMPPNPTAGDPFSRGLASGYADFTPYRPYWPDPGLHFIDHYEDYWNETAISRGKWDRGSQNETSTARMTIAAAIRQKPGLSALSAVYMGVHNQRRYRGHLAAPPTFKPPPRVTLTDTKREAWMKDLANPDIPLRRLSRTIPHGIRGRTLLDQCLSKGVPADRAIWLAKCVGANEFRAFKRKGNTTGAGGTFSLAGEFKWVRDWTIMVEQFLETFAFGYHDPDWKPKLTYAYVFPSLALPLLSSPYHRIAILALPLLSSPYHPGLTILALPLPSSPLLTILSYYPRLLSLPYYHLCFRPWT